MTNGLVNHFQIHVVLYVMSMSCHMSLRYVCYSSKQPLVCSQLRTASMALFRLPAQICFLAYSDCVQIDFKKVWPQKSHVKSHEATFGDGLKLQSDIYRCIPDALGAQIRFRSVFCIVTRHIDVKFKVAEVH